MNAPKFTPGPWVIVIPPQGSDEIRSADETSELICELPYGAGVGIGGSDAANAALIAAAPDGYTLAEAIERLESSPLQSDYVPPEIQKMARAFLAKARGETP